MALKDLITWFTGDNARDQWPNGGGAPSAMPNTHERKTTGTTKFAEWRNNAKPDAVSEAFFDDARREMDRMREEFWKDKGGFGQGLPSQMLSSSGLKIDETAQDYRVTVEVPGFAEKDVTIEPRETTLMISAEQRSQHENGDSNHRFSEHFVNRFERIVSLKTAIDPSKVTSTFGNGVLHVTLPKKR